MQPVSAKGVATRERILAAAVTRFADQGFHNTSVAAIARDARVSGPAVHAYFASKQDLFHAAFERDVGPVLAALDTVAGARRGLAGNAAGGIAGAGDDAGSAAGPMLQVMAELMRHPLALRVFSGGEPVLTRQLMTLPAVAEAHERLVGRVRAGQEAGVLRPDLPAAALAGALETIMFALLLGALQLGVGRDAERLRAIAAVISQGIAAR